MTRHIQAAPAPLVNMQGNAVKALDLTRAPELLVNTSAAPRLTETDIYQAVAWVYRCVEIRSHSISSIPFTLEGENALVNLESVQRGLPTLVRRIESSLCLHGAAYGAPQRNKYGVMTGVQWFAASTVEPIFDEDAGIKEFLRTLKGGKRSIKPADMLHFWLPDPDVEMGPGNHPAAVALQAASIVANSNAFAQAFFERGALNVTLLVVDPTASEHELQRLETWWKRAARGVRRAWETIAVRKNVEPKMLGYPPEQLAMPQLKSMSRSEIANAFGIPEAMLTQSANYASAREHRLAYWNDTVVPEAQFIEAVLNEQLFEPLGLKFTYRYEALSVFQKDESTEIQGVIDLYSSGLISLNEARARIGLDPVGQDTVPGERPGAVPSAPVELAPDATVQGSPGDPNAVAPGSSSKPNTIAPPAPTSGARRSVRAWSPDFDTSGGVFPYSGRRAPRKEA